MTVCVWCDCTSRRSATRRANGVGRCHQGLSGVGGLEQTSHRLVPAERAPADQGNRTAQDGGAAPLGLRHAGTISVQRGRWRDAVAGPRHAGRIQGPEREGRENDGVAGRAFRRNHGIRPRARNWNRQSRRSRRN